MVVCQREKEDRERFHGSRVADIMTQGYGQLDLRFLQNVQIKVLDRSPRENARTEVNSSSGLCR